MRLLGIVLSTLAASAYVLATMRWRFEQAFGEWSADPDMRQAVWQYWRYHIDGAFPPGDLLTDYAFVMHAPLLWWLMMAPLSVFLKPFIAATVLNVIAYVATCVAAYLVIKQRGNHYVSLMGPVLIAHSLTFHAVTAGGYARSFGPLLVLLFLAAFIAKRHYLVLVILTVQAALYPSVVIPCGIAYGVACMLVGDNRTRVRRTLETLGVGVIVIAFGLYQDLLAPDWWGSVVSLKEASQMPVWGRGGRVPEVPMRHPGIHLYDNVARAFLRLGHQPFDSLSALNAKFDKVLSITVFGAMLLFVVVRRLTIVPVQIAGLAAASVAAYFLARLLAFKLYLPYRALTHVLPYLAYVAGPLMAYAIAVHLLPKRKVAATVLALVLGLGPNLLLTGDGLGKMRATYRGHGQEKALFEFVQKLPLDSVIAANFYLADRIPLFAYHRVFVNKGLAHPFRAGLYEELERRVYRTYHIIYATDGCDVLDMAREEGIDYIATTDQVFHRPDSQFFEPVRKPLTKMFNQNKGRFFLSNPPAEAVLFREKNARVIGVAELARALADTCPLPTKGTP